MNSRGTKAWVLFFFLLLFHSSAWAKTLKVAIVSAEQGSLFASGGLGQAVEGLALELNRTADVKADVIIPHYQSIQKSTQPTGESYAGFDVSRVEQDGLKTFLLKSPAYFGNVDGSGRKFYGPQNNLGEAFGAFSKAAADFVLKQKYDVVIINDWHTGFVAPYLRQAEEIGAKRPATIFAVHNMGYDLLMDRDFAEFAGLDPKHFHIDGFEYFGRISPFKAGLMFSDASYAVSPQYAAEIRDTRFGQGFSGVAAKLDREHRLTGILNGINEANWDPARAEIPFSKDDLSGKAQGKAKLQSELGLLANPIAPLIIMTSRISEQKGFDYLPEALQHALEMHPRIQLIISGDADQARYHQALSEIQSRYPGRVAYRSFNPALEKKATAYGDFFLNASWYEPSGLNQMYSMKNGTLPIVSRVGGLANSVTEGRTGFFLDIAPSEDGRGTNREQTRDSIVAAIDRAVGVYENDPPGLARMRLAAMSEANSWANRVPEFLALFDYVKRKGPERLQRASKAEGSAGKRPTELLKLLGR